jgi:DNA-binding response OmpR family regulator
MRVLVVEDEQQVAGALTETLTELGHRPHVVGSGEAALGRMAVERPDAIILDVDLPDMSGPDFLRLPPIRESGVPVVAVSDGARDLQARECLRLGAFDFVAKPVSLDRLREVFMYLADRAAVQGRAERRRAVRVPIELPVRVIEDGGVEWTGTSVDLSAFGIRVRTHAPTGGSAAVSLEFTPPDDGPPIRARALVARQVEGYGLYFVHLGDEEFRRLTVLVQRLLAR